MSATIEGPAPETVAPETADASGGQRGRLLRTVLPVSALLAMIVVFALASENFLTLPNLTVMSAQAGPLLLASLGATFVVLAGSIDLSVGSTALLAGAIAAWLLANEDLGFWVVPIAVAAGALTGTVSGALVAYGRVPSFVATLGMLSVLAGLALTVLDGSPISFVSESVSWLSTGQLVPHVQNAGLVALVVWAVLLLVGTRTRFGLYVTAIGGGERVAQLSGIDVRRLKLAVFALSGATAALAGVVSIGQLGSGGPTLGSSFLLDSLAAIVVGGTALAGGFGGVHRTLLGVLLITVLANGLNQLGTGEYLQQVVKGAVVVVAVLLTTASRREGIVK
ncbi:MAG TPA: ABC transporter permease [Capillimicrobium sp.]|jgi:ribose transport system permease protein